MTTTQTLKPCLPARHIVRTAAAKSPYRRVAVLAVDPFRDSPPAMISARARGVVRITHRWERQFVGKTSRCAYRQALSAALEIAQELDGECDGRGEDRCAQ